MNRQPLVSFSLAAIFFGGSLLCTPAGAELRAGYAKADITPSGPVWLGGYQLRSAPSDGIYPGEKLYVRALVFDDGSTRMAFVEADVIGARDHGRLRESISRETGIPVGNILLGDVHNHAAPSPGQKNAEWTREYESAMLAAVKNAAAALTPVRIAAGQGVSHIGVNRRAVLPADVDSYKTFDENNTSQSFGQAKTDHPVLIHEFAGDMRLGSNPAGSIDETVQVVRIDAGERPLAVMVHYACHGTSMGGRNGKVSGEWMGRMQAYLESEFPGVGSIFIQGAAGDVNPRVVGGLDGNPDDIRITHALGEEIGREVVRVYRDLRPVPQPATRIEVTFKDILLPRTYRELAANYANPAVHAPTTVVRIGDLMWVTFPGEMFHAIGQFVKSACPSACAHLMGYTNGSIGYFPEQKAFAEGGYEPASSHLAPVAERIYRREIAELMKHVR
jgi:neutral ceramidase